MNFDGYQTRFDKHCISLFFKLLSLLTKRKIIKENAIKNHCE